MPDYKVKVKVAAPAEEVVKLMATADYAREEALMDGAVKAVAEIKERAGDRIVIEVKRDDPSRGPGGKVANKTEKNIITQEWDVPSMKCKWNCKVPGMEKLVKISGTTWLESKGDSECEMHETGSVDIKVPLVGNVIAKGVVSDIKKDFPAKAGFIEKKMK